MSAIVQTLIKEFSELINRGTESSTNKEKELRNSLLSYYRQVEKLVITRLDAIGDSLLFTNSMAQIKKLFPNANITYITYYETHEIIDRCPYLNVKIYIDRTLLATNKFYREKIFTTMQNYEFDLLINPLFSREYQAEELVQFINSKIKIGIRGDNSNIDPALLKVTDKYYDVLLETENVLNKFELHRNAEIINLLGGNLEPDILPELWESEYDKNFVSEFLSHNKIENYAVVFPGSKGGKGSIKYWGSQKFAKLIDYLQENLHLNVLLLGGVEEEEVCEEIINLSKTQPILLQGQFSLWNSVEILKNSLLYVGSDTSIAHFSAAVGIQTVVILGGGHFGRFFPYPDSKHVKSVYKKLTCYNCNWKCTKPTNECIQVLSVEEIANACREIIRKKPQFFISNNEYKKEINILKNRGSLPKIDILLPPSNMHSWHLKDAWVFNLRSKGIINKAFYTSEKNHNYLFDYIRKGGQADFLIAIGGDHHLYYLHDTPEKREIWNKYNSPRICFSYESTSETIYEVYKQRSENALKVFSHFLAADEKDVDFYIKNGKKAIWFPQFVDHNFFKNIIPFSERKTGLFFKGKLWKEYSLRRKVIDELVKSNLCKIYDKFITNTELVQLYNSYKSTINPPGVFCGFNVRTFEALASGNILFQFLPENRPLNNNLFKDGEHLIYFNPNDLKSTTTKIQAILRDLDSHKIIAENGFNEVMEHHTLEKRFESLLDWIDNGVIPSYPNYNSNKKGRGKESNIILSKVGNLNTENKPNIVKSEYLPDIKVSAIVSTYNSGNFIEGCLNDLVNQTIFRKGKLEIVVVNTGSTQDEKEIVTRFQKKYSNIKYIETKQRETIYKAWNIGIQSALGCLITNANTDDRHKPEALEIMVNAFEKNPDVDVVYGDVFTTIKPNDHWGSTSSKAESNWIQFDKDLILFGCFLGPQPMWKKSLHEKFGNFRDDLKVVGDYEFWLRISRSAKFLHLSEKLGLYLYSPSSAEHNNKSLTKDENKKVQNEYVIKYISDLNEITRIKKKLAPIKNSKEQEAYFNTAMELLDRREKGINLQLLIIDFIKNSNEYTYEDIIKVSENIQRDLISNDTIVDKMIIENYYLIMGVHYLKNGNIYESQKKFESALETNVISSQAYVGLGEIYLILKDYNTAKNHFENALKLSPDNGLALKGIKRADETMVLSI